MLRLQAYIADILLAGGKIAGIGTDLTAPADAEIFDADGLDVYPGFVDAHTHIGLDIVHPMWSLCASGRINTKNLMDLLCRVQKSRPAHNEPGG